MEYIDLNEYIETKMKGIIVKRRNSLFIPIVILAIGVAALVLALVVNLGDIVQVALLSAGSMTAAVGLVWVILGLCGSLRHYHYQPTNSRMRKRRIYLTPEDLHHCEEAIRNNDIAIFTSIKPATDSNCALNVIYSTDMNIALLQAVRYDGPRTEPTTDVMVVNENAALLAPLFE